MDYILRTLTFVKNVTESIVSFVIGVWLPLAIRLLTIEIASPTR